MHNRLGHWLLFGLLLGWALSHATVFGQQGGKSAGDKLRQDLNKSVTIDYTGQSLSEVLAHFRDKTGLTVNIDQLTLLQMGLNPDDNIGQVHLKASSEKAGQALRRMLNAYQLTYILFEGSLLVTSEEMAVIRQLRQRVSVDLEDVPFKKAVRDLAKSHGINLVLDPKVQKQAETTVSLQLDNAGIETTVRLLAELAGLKAVRMGNVTFITTEEKAKKIREEEAHQLDNPLNPNVSRSSSPYGTFDGGGIVMPARAIGPALPVAPPPAAEKVAPVPLPGIDPPPLAPQVKRIDGPADNIPAK